ncbi:MAG TPA: hypothetical protein VII05_02890 [Gaiellaceae bacterium]
MSTESPPESPVESQFQPVEGADEMLDMPLGTLIFRAGLIAPQQLEDALAEGLRSGKRLGEVLLSRGWLSEEDLSRLLAGQKGLPYADLEKIAIDRELAQAMSYDDARNEMALPVVTEFGLPVVAMADPDESAMDRLRAQLGPEVRFVVAAPSVLSRLIDEVLGGAPASGLVMAPRAEAENQPVEGAAPTEPAVEQQYAAVDEAQVEPVAVSAEPEQATPEPEQEPVAPDLAAQEIRPIIAEGEIEYPTFSEFQPIPEVESIKGPDELLPTEVQTGEYGYFDDPTLLEGNAWQAGETGPPGVESADQVGPEAEIEQPEAEPEQPVEEAVQPEPEQPVAEQIEQPEAEAEQPVDEVLQEPAEELSQEPEPAASTAEETVPEQPAEPFEEVGEVPAEEDLITTTLPWMQGEVNAVTADVADFIDSGAPAAEPPLPLSPGSEELVESQPEQIVEEAAEAPVAEVEAVEPDVPEPAESEPEAEPVAEPTGWQDEAEEASEQAPIEPPTSPGEEARSAEVLEGQYELVLRLVDGDRISIGTFASLDEARGQAGEVVKQFAEVKEGSWPFIGGRFLRPDTIVSIDVEEEHGTSWGGSNARRTFGGDSGE